jgi:hypothetical protein
MIRYEIESNSSYSELFSFFRFEFLSMELIGDFVSWSCENFERVISLDLWIAICGCLCLSVDVKKNVNPRHYVKAFHFNRKSDTPLSGIIAYLTSTHCGNVADRGIVNVSASTTNSSNVAKYAVDLPSRSCFESLNQPNQWLCYDFKDRKVRPAHYSIHAYSGRYLRSWTFEGSKDGSTWTELDRHTNDQTTNANHPIGTFSVSTDSEYRFVRLRQTGVTADGNHYLTLYGLEIFGDLIE